MGRRMWAHGGMIFAATLLLVIGLFQLFQGISLLRRSFLYVINPAYLYAWNSSNWGWVHVGLGIALIVIGAFLYTGLLFARILGVLAAAASMVANFFWLPYYPFWALLIIALDVFVIWACVAVGSRRQQEMMRAQMAAAEGGSPYYGERAEMTGRTTAEQAQSREKWAVTNEPSERSKTVDTGHSAHTADAEQREHMQPPASSGRRKQEPEK